jgi:hypothetical protein
MHFANWMANVPAPPEPAWIRLISDWTDLTFARCIVDRPIEAAEASHRLVDHDADVYFLAHISVDELGLGTEGAQLLDESLTGFLAPTGHDNLRALLGERDGCGTPDAGEATGN